MHKLYSTLLLIFSITMCFAQNNRELQKMADKDQESRMSGKVDWVKLNKQDSLRRIRVFELIDENKLKTAKDHYNAGIVFQHGNDTVSSKMAVQNFKKAIEMDSTLNRWWYAAAVDRDLMRRNEPQIYGTQYVSNPSTNGKFKRYKIDTTQITDKERKYYRVQTLVEQRAKERTMNLKSVNDKYSQNKSIDETIAFIETEIKKGKESNYNVSEMALNSFGYQLIAKNKLNEALKVLKLNTELFPKAFNTWDSYGEILLKVGRKKEAIKAYKKSLKLNPENENAKEIISRS